MLLKKVIVIFFYLVFQKVVVETLMKILEELKNLNQGDSDDEVERLPVETPEDLDAMSGELVRKQHFKRSLVNQIKICCKI